MWLDSAIAEIKALHESDERWERYVAEMQRAQAQEMPTVVLVQELESRGWEVRERPCSCSYCRGRLRHPLPFEVERDE